MKEVKGLKPEILTKNKKTTPEEHAKLNAFIRDLYGFDQDINVESIVVAFDGVDEKGEQCKSVEVRSQHSSLPADFMAYFVGSWLGRVMLRRGEERGTERIAGVMMRGYCEGSNMRLGLVRLSDDDPTPAPTTKPEERPN